MMIKTFIRKGNEGRGNRAPRLVIGIPSGVTASSGAPCAEAGLAGRGGAFGSTERWQPRSAAGLPVTDTGRTFDRGISRRHQTEVAVVGALARHRWSASPVRVRAMNQLDRISVPISRGAATWWWANAAADGDQDPDPSAFPTRPRQRPDDRARPHLLLALPHDQYPRRRHREAMADPLNVIVRR